METGYRFVDRVGLELKRAERYRIFLSLIVIDLAFLDRLVDTQDPAVLRGLLNKVKVNIREVDHADIVQNRKLALVLPETPRQGAEITARRLSDLIRKNITGGTNGDLEDLIPLEMASYPDAAGARTIAEHLQDLSQVSMN